MPRKISFTLHFWHKSYILHHHHRHRRLLRVNRCAAAWLAAISDLHSIDSSRALASSWTLLSHDVARTTRRPVLLQLVFLPSWVSIIKRTASYAGTPGSRRAIWPEISVDDVICHQWLTNHIAEAPLHWRHEPSSMHQVSVADTSCGKPPVYSCRPPRGSMFVYLRAEQTLSVLGTGVLWCW